jgi:hypothetical protein
MARLLKRRLPILAAVAVLILGGAVAAMAAGGAAGTGHAHRHGAARAPHGAHLLQSAATYLGVSVQTLKRDLHTGKSLGQLATETGKSEAGLVKALSATAAGGIEERMSELVKAPGGRRGHRAGRRLRAAAAAYLGLSPSTLRSDLRSGKTLAEVADATPGHSSAGLVDALLAAREAERAADGVKLTSGLKAATVHAAHLRARITAFVDQTHLGAAKAHKSGN